MSSNSERILPLSGLCVNGLCASGLSAASTTALHSSAATRQLETLGRAQPEQSSLMQRAGLALARLALAVAPHAQIFWIACGPGNNGGDGFAAAAFLQQWGKTALISYLDNPAQAADARGAHLHARSLSIAIGTEVPAQFDACLDCLFGIGSLRTFSSSHCNWIAAMNNTAAPVIAADVPTGLNADTGATHGPHVKADYTLSLLTLKPGLFTADGREACGEIWFNNLGVEAAVSPVAELITRPAFMPRAHNTHKGSFGDVAVLGGAQGMTGAALLAASAALHGGAGRVFVGLLQSDAPSWDSQQPELMFRDPRELQLDQMTVVAGCGGGSAIAAYLDTATQTSARLVLDADALNHIAAEPKLRDLIRQRPVQSTVLTPHPLEAARLLGCSTAQVQADRLQAAQSLAAQFKATVVLKGSGTIVATPERLPAINTSGNGLLASGGTGDVLAGLMGARLANGLAAHDAARDAVHRHGAVADQWNPKLSGALTAAMLSSHC